MPRRPGAISLKVRLQRGIIKPGQALLESAAGDIKQVRFVGVEHISHVGMDPKTFDASVIWVMITYLSAAEAQQYHWIVQPTYYN